MNIDIGIQLGNPPAYIYHVETIYLCDENMNRITTENGNYLIF